MTDAARFMGNSGALFEISGFVPTNATWSEDIYFSEAGAPTDLTGLSFKMSFRCSEEDDAAIITLSTDAGTLSVVEDTDSGVNRILRINVPAGTYSTYDGDYICDLASKDAQNSVLLWAHGVVTLRKNPVAWT